MNRLGRIQSLSDQLKKLGGAALAPTQPSVDNIGWAARRGEIRTSVDCDVIGNFPGFHRSAALIVGAQTLITPAYLIVDEGEPHGFALPLASITDVSLDDAAHAGPDLIVRYRHASDAGWFRLRESRGRLRRKGTKGIDSIRAAFRAGGASFGETASSFNAYLLVPWDAARSLEAEPEIWSSRVTAPVRATLECAPVNAWLSPSSLVWGSGKGEGVNRLPLTAIRSLAPLTLADPGATPAVFVSTFGPENIPVSLPFIFDSGPDREAARDEFLELFSQSLVTEPDATPPLQPWNDPEPIADEEDDISADNDVFDELVEIEESEVDTEVPDTGESAIDEGETPAWETWSAARPPARFGIDPGGSSRTGMTIGSNEPIPFDSTGMRLTEAISVWPTATDTPDDESLPEAQAPLEPTAIPAYLSAARKAIAEVNEIIDRRVAGNSAMAPRAIPPSTEQQAAALAELVELVGSGFYTADASRAVKSQITRFGEAAIRIRSLLELCNAGHMTIAETGAKRDVIMRGLPSDAEE